jgi:hypothetical protein
MISISYYNKSFHCHCDGIELTVLTISISILRIVVILLRILYNYIFGIAPLIPTYYGEKTLTIIEGNYLIGF